MEMTKEEFRKRVRRTRRNERIGVFNRFDASMLRIELYQMYAGKPARRLIAEHRGHAVPIN